MNKFIFSIDGNIGSGKSTLVDYLKQNLKDIGNYNVIFLQEPIEIWNKIKDLDGTSILEKYYSNPERYSFAFQMMAYITRLSTLRKAFREAPNNTIILTERSLHTDYNIFAKMLHDSGKIEEVEYSIYCNWFYEFIDELGISGFIYLQNSPEVCYSRIQSRNRKGEENISIEYLIDCDKYHEKWLIDTNCLYLKDTNEFTLYQISNFILKTIR